jgi:predicted  nucleic acid-binding Zn-ribbon protein
MYQCKECRELFDQPGEISEDESQADGAKDLLVVPCCPSCGSTNFHSLPDEEEELFV